MCFNINPTKYVRINDNVGALLDGISRVMFMQPYIYIRRAILDNVNVANDGCFQVIFRHFFGMNRVKLRGVWLQTYFQLMSGGIEDLNPRRAEGLDPRENADRAQIVNLLGQVVHRLHDVDIRHGGQDKVQFSFPTKMLHVINPDLPIYDSMVAKFYGSLDVASLDHDGKVEKYLCYYKCLIDEYHRVIDEGDLNQPIEKFRRRFGVRDDDVFSDIKVIDTLIWQFQAWLEYGHRVSRQPRPVYR